MDKNNNAIENQKNKEFLDLKDIYEVLKSIVQIKIQNSLGSGFFIKFQKENKTLNCLMSCEHVINKEAINSNMEMEILFDNQKELRKIILNKKERFIRDYTYLGLDAVIVEIKPDDFVQTDYFLLPNLDYEKEGKYNQFINKDIYITQFPEGKTLKYSEEKIKEVNEFSYTLTHLSKTNKGSSGSPIILKDTSTVLGIHKGRKKDIEDEKIGYFIGPIIESLKNNYELIEMKYNNVHYRGEVININSINNGYGKLEYENKEYYIGEWKNFQKHGKGTLYYKNGRIQYQGEYQYDEKEGFGKYFKKNGEYYIGQLINGKAHGKGKYYDKNKKIEYEGDFAFGKLEGKGKRYYSNNIIYEGDFENGLETGIGKFYLHNKLLYEGKINKGKLENNEGKTIIQDDMYYIGEYKDNKMDGKGIIFHKDNSIYYEGEFKDT